ncbi:MAG TPA: hypothetical protein VFT84_03125, partial [Gemmatimonadales bacterium]|nr:hypothetical protein [Gemmatimonadales bacterium]
MSTTCGLSSALGAIRLGMGRRFVVEVFLPIVLDPPNRFDSRRTFLVAGPDAAPRRHLGQDGMSWVRGVRRGKGGPGNRPRLLQASSAVS